MSDTTEEDSSTKAGLIIIKNVTLKELLQWKSFSDLSSPLVDRGIQGHKPVNQSMHGSNVVTASVDNNLLGCGKLYHQLLPKLFPSDC